MKRSDISRAINSLSSSDSCICARSASSHYLNQYWHTVNWPLRNKVQWNYNRNSYFFIQENAFEYDVCKMVAILYRTQWVNSFRPGDAHVHQLSTSVAAMACRLIGVKAITMNVDLRSIASSGLKFQGNPSAKYRPIYSGLNVLTIKLA